MKLHETDLKGVCVITPVQREDSRGYFSETFRQDWFDDNVAKVNFVQENQSFSRSAGVVRGLHFQTPPFAQGKLVRCISGAIFDVAVDIRSGSPTYGHWTAVTLSAEDGNQLWIPAGFLHGFCTLVPDCLVAYKVTAYYEGQADEGVRWDDPEIGIDWPNLADPALLSVRDSQQSPLKTLPSYFNFGEVS